MAKNNEQSASSDKDFLGKGTPLTAPPFALEKGQRAVLKYLGNSVAEVMETTNDRQSEGTTYKLQGAAFEGILAGVKAGQVIKIVGRGLERTKGGNNVRAYDARIAETVNA